EEQQAEFQRIVDELNAHFLAAVGLGRGLSAERVAELADGRVHLAGSAMGLGLIDGVGSLEEAYRELRGASEKTEGKSYAEGAEKPQRAAEKRESTGFTGSTGWGKTTQERGDGEMGEQDVKKETVAQESTAAVADKATIAELEAACPGADAAWLLGQVKAGGTVSQAQGAYIAEQASRREKEKAEAEAREKELRERAEKAEAKEATPGVDALGSGKAGSGTDESDPVAAWEAGLAEKTAAGKSREQAARELAREQPELREAMVAAYNAGRKK
ncbi:MAG TPA: S49 family peptidase, partial [Phycisphaerae bacterium]|nr:S49 family peptidase [Phycisphaerae bacterium]